MSRTHEVPNHLNVQDTLFLGLTARQVATFMAFASPAYGIWDQLTIAPLPVRGALAAFVVLAGIAFTLLQPGGRPLDEWAFAVGAHAVSPPALALVSAGSDPVEWSPGGSPGWVDLAPRLGWGTGARDFNNDQDLGS
ncbi:MAG: PrgI family protein [Chloroflexi bacterium]|nr:PrgI family protein [Chloroflexota bacterium]